jgi:hypothetical protein
VEIQCITKYKQVTTSFENLISLNEGFFFNLINQPDAATSQVYYLLFKYSSTCFGRLYAHHQELNNWSSSLWFYRWSLVIAVLLVVVGPAVRLDSVFI